MLRLLFSLVLIGVIVFIYQQRKAGRGGSNTPLLANDPSAEGADRFRWIPAYPGAQLSDIHTRVTHGELNYGYDFQTPDDLQKVSGFYQEKLRASGFTVQSKDKGGVEIDLHGEAPDRTRMIDVTVEQIKQESGTTTGVSVAALQK
ncbi:MAG: hypothetical protein ABL967_16935 [Bryobacteraceae bacterium]